MLIVTVERDYALNSLKIDFELNHYLPVVAKVPANTSSAVAQVMKLAKTVIVKQHGFKQAVR